MKHQNHAMILVFINFRKNGTRIMDMWYYLTMDIIQFFIRQDNEFDIEQKERLYYEVIKECDAEECISKL